MKILKMKRSDYSSIVGILKKDDNEDLLCDPCHNFPLNRSQKLEDVKWYFQVNQGKIYSQRNHILLPMVVGTI